MSFPTGPFVRAGCLFLLRDGTTKYPMKIEPPTFPFGMDFKTLLVHAFPEHVESSTVYAFSVQKYMCYVFVHKSNDICHSYILVSDQPTPRLYFEFLEDVKAVLEEGIVVTPELLLDMMMSTVAAWKYQGDEIRANFLQARHTVNKNTYTTLDCFQYLSNKVNLPDLWRFFLLGKRILLLGDPKRPEILSKAFFGVMSLSPHIPYKEAVMLMPNPEDERNMENLDNYKVIATTSRRILSNAENKFDIVIELRNDPTTEFDHFKKEIKARNERLFNILCYLIERKMLEDPYNELLKKPIAGEELRTEMSRRAMEFTMTADQLIQLANSRSVSIWRDEMVLENGFRDKFLSNSAEYVLSKKSDEELEACVRALDVISPKFEADQHMMAVIGSHRRFIARRLDNHCL